MISIEGLGRNYGDVVALEDVNARIERGQIVGLLGHNGAGKTTLMKVLTGYLEPSRGKVTVDGNDVVEQREAVQRLIGYLPENAPMYPEMLVQDYLWMMAGLRGLEGDVRARAVVRSVRATGLDGRLAQRIGTLSKGFQQRVGLAQAIVHDPDVLVLDEPTNGLDPSQIQAIRNLIRRLGEHSTVLISTHILQEVEAVCDRVLILIGGRLVADSPLADLVRTRNVRLSVDADRREVERVLRSSDGIAGIDHLGPDPELFGFERWSVQCTESHGGAPALAALARASSWRLGAVAPEHGSLERVFRDLEQREALRARREEAR